MRTATHGHAVEHELDPKSHTCTVALSLAAETLGFKDLKAEQREVIKAFINGNDVFAALPTRSGKCLCFVVLLTIFCTENQRLHQYSSVFLH